MFSKKPRCQYANNQLADVICQLRFPEILTINANSPANFQEEIRADFPNYTSTVEAAAPQISGTPGNLQIQNQPTTLNYQFTSVDGIWRINLTSKFISLACNHYQNWEAFAQKLDKPLAAFIRIYRPAYFERIGLRYLNFFSRESLDLDGIAFRDMISSTYLGLLDDDEVTEDTAHRSGVDAEISLPGGARVKLHAGPGLVKQNGVPQKEVKFIFDQDLFITGNVPVNFSAGALQTLHSHAYPIFRGAITDLLHNAMKPKTI